MSPSLAFIYWDHNFKRHFRAGGALHLLLFFQLPTFYASEASIAFTWAERLKDFEPGVIVPAKGRIVHDLGTGTLFKTLSTVALGSYTATVMHVHAQQLQGSWSSYIDSRYREWCVIATLAVTYVMASPALPGANCDDLTRSFIFVSSLRAISSSLYATMLLVFFRKAQTNTERFAIVWFQRAKEDKQSLGSMPWTILAMPAISLCWGVVFFVLSVLSSLWNESFGQRIPLDTEPMGLLARSLFGIIVTIFTLLDLAFLVWIWRVFKKLEAVCEDHWRTVALV